jgi:cyanophycinase
VDEVIVDQHFVRRQRWARLVSAVLDHPEFVGVGIDERTAVEVGGDVWRVWGDGSVVVLDARRAEAAAGLPGEHSTARDVQFSILKDGETFSLR